VAHSLNTKLLRLALGLAVIAGLSVFAPRGEASCGDYVQLGQSAHANPGIASAKAHSDSTLPPGSEQPAEGRPCSGPHCGHQPVQLPAPIAPASTGSQFDQWGLPISVPINLRAGSQCRACNEGIHSAAAHPDRIERPPR